MQKTHRSVLAIIAVAVLGAGLLIAIILLRPSDDGDNTETSAHSTPPADVTCRAEGEFVAGFMSPQNDDQPTEALLDRMNTDAVTFGGRIVPTEIDDYPDPVAEAIADRQAYDYTVQMHWRGIDLGDADTVVQAEDTEYGIIDAGDNSVVVTQSDHDADPFHSLTRVASERDTKALIGLPVPQMRTSGETWLPDHSYADVVDGFAEKFVQAYHERGADGFYLAMEMPLTDAAHWDPVTDYYGRQTKIINQIAEGATVLISPYLEGREDRETITPDTAAQGYAKLLGIAHGTHVLVSPQDGVGADTTALAADESDEHRFTVEEYFEALQAVDAERLYATVEAMRPGDGTAENRSETSRERVEAQLDATDPCVQGAIGFQWSEPNAMTELQHIGHGACAAGPDALQ